jgi:hypothetical protein
MNYSHSLLSALDLSTDSPSHNATSASICPHCSHPNAIPKVTDTLREIQERVVVAEQ